MTNQQEQKNSGQPKVERLLVGPLATNCYILKSGEEMAVIDPGGDAELIIAKTQELSGKVKYIIDTHGHIDHVAANKEVLDATGAELLIGELDARMLTNPDPGFAAMFGIRLEPLNPTRTLAEDDEVVVGEERLRVIHTPGHTPGGITLIGKGYAFTGDTLFLDSIGRMDFPGGSEAQMQNSLGRLQALIPKDTMLYPGHNEPGTMARALLINPFLGSIWPG